MLTPLLPVAILLAASQTPEIVAVNKIWDGGAHNAFGDLIRYRNRWVAICREGGAHVPVNHAGDGKVRVLVSNDGEHWDPAALIEEPGVDLRDPHLSITAKGQLMIVAGGSVYENKKYIGRQPRVMFSKDAVHWTKPRKVLEESHWLWRVTWYKGRGYGVSKYGAIAADSPENLKRATLYSTKDGVHYEPVVDLKVPGIDETTIRFLADGSMLALSRRETTPPNAWIGTAKPPYKEWKWTDAGQRVGGPNLIVLPGGAIWGGGRSYAGAAKTVLAKMTADSYTPVLTLPSGGDNSYPGFVWQDGYLWMLYYSTHEGRTSLYLAKIRLPG